MCAATPAPHTPSLCAEGKFTAMIVHKRGQRTFVATSEIRVDKLMYTVLARIHAQRLLKTSDQWMHRPRSETGASEIRTEFYLTRKSSQNLRSNSTDLFVSGEHPG
jgi:hypothetical protein